MAGEIIRPKDLTPRPTPVASELMVVDNSVNVGAATIKAIVEAGRPAASQAEAQTGTDAVKAMTPLTTKQSIAAEVGVSLASKAQGDLAATAVQLSDLSAVATSGAYEDLSGKPMLGTAAAQDSSAFASSAQGTAADSAVQPGDLASVAISGSYNDLSDKPALGGGEFKTVAALLADAALSYTPGPGLVIVTPGDIVEAQGFRYEVAASGASDHHLATVGGVKLRYIANGPLNVLAFGVVGNRVTDDYAALQKAFDAVPDGGAIYLPKRGGTLASYYTSQPLVLTKGDVTIFSDPLSEYTEGFYSDKAITILDVRAYGLRLDNLVLMGNGSTDVFATTNGLKIDQTSKGDAEGWGNLDAIITNCMLFNLKDCIVGKGRNVLVKDCLFSQSKRGVVGLLHTYGAGLVSSFRGWRVLGNRFHNMGSQYHSATSTETVPANLSLLDSWCVEMPLNSNIASHIEVRDNNFDVGMAGFYKGPLAASAIDNNIGYLVNPILVYSPITDAPAISFSSQYFQSISGNVVNARGFPDERRGYTLAAHHIVVNGTRNLAIRGNDLSNSYDRSLVLTETNGLRLSDTTIVNANMRFLFDSVQRNAAQILTANNVRVKDTDITWTLSGTPYDIGLVMTGTGLKVRDTTVTGATTKYSIPAASLMPSDDDALAWQAPAMTNSFVLSGGLSSGYRKRFDGSVEISAVVTGGSSGTQVFNLPLGYRPPASIQLSGVGRDTSGYVTIAANGTVTANWTGTVASLNINAVFPAAG